MILLNLEKNICKFLAQELSRHIDYCDECKKIKELNKINQMAEKVYGEKIYSVGKTISEFLNYFNIPKKCYDFIISNLKHNHNLENKNYDKFKVYNEEGLDEFLEIDIEEWYKFSRDHGITIREAEFELFVYHLALYPMLGHKFIVGKKIYNLLKDIYEYNDYLENLKGEKIYRGRLREKGTNKFKPEKMWNPPHGRSTHGRYNIVGTPVLYCSEKKTGIPYELNYSNEHELNIATIIVNKPMKILDLSNFSGDFGKYLSEKPQKNNKLNKEYLLTNYIAECCKEIGYNAIKYRGVRKEEKYANYAFLNFEKGESLEIEKVEKMNF